MKKLVSLALALLLCVSLAAGLCISASADNVTQMLLNVGSETEEILEGDPGTVYTVSKLYMWYKSHLVIPAGVTLKIKQIDDQSGKVPRLDFYSTDATIDVYGRLEGGVQGTYIHKNDKIIIHEGGSVSFSYPAKGSYTSPPKNLPDPKTVFVAANGENVTINISVSGETVTVTADPATQGSAISGGSIAIIAAVAVIAAGAVTGIIVSKKKKSGAN